MTVVITRNKKVGTLNFEDYFDSHGFDDGDSPFIDAAYTLRPSVVHSINKSLTTQGFAGIRAELSDPMGCHNECMIAVYNADGNEVEIEFGNGTPWIYGEDLTDAEGQVIYDALLDAQESFT